MPKEINGLVTTRLNTYGYFPGHVNESAQMAVQEKESEEKEKEKEKEAAAKAATATAVAAASKAKSAPPATAIPVPKGGTSSVDATPTA